MSIYDLHDDELADAYSQAVAAVKRRLAQPNVTYASLARQIGVREDSLKKFVRRLEEVVDGSSVIRRGSVFFKVHSQLVSDGDIQVPNDRVLNNIQRLKGYSFILSMLGINPDAVRSAGLNLLDRERFLCFRNSTDRSRVEISELAFHNLGGHQDPVWEFSHHFTEGDSSQRNSEGPVIVLNNIVYLFGDIQLGQGLEVMIFRQPAGSAKFIPGFAFSIDDSYNPFFANIVLIESSDSKEYGRFDIRMVKEPCFIRKDVLKKSVFGENKNFGSLLLEQLKIDSSEDVLRIKREKIIDDFSF